MQFPQPRPPFARRKTPAPSPAAAPGPLTIILYSVGPEVAAECTHVAREMQLARAEVKHLHAACTAVKTHARAFLVASASIRSWDRQVIEEHAERAGVPTRWVASEADADDIATEIKAWAFDTQRRSRTPMR